jgi:hypothetical protein
MGDAIIAFFGAAVIGFGVPWVARSWGFADGAQKGRAEMRNRVIVHCIEKPQLCKEEYTFITTQAKLSEFQRPEIGALGKE